MKNFARVMGLPFGSAGAHTYPKFGQVAPPPRGSANLEYPVTSKVKILRRAPCSSYESSNHVCVSRGIEDRYYRHRDQL